MVRTPNVDLSVPTQEHTWAYMCTCIRMTVYRHTHIGNSFMKLIIFAMELLSKFFIEKEIIMAQNMWNLDRELTTLICEVFLGNNFSILDKR